MTASAFDFLLVALLVAYALAGYRRGLLLTLASAVGFVAGALLAIWFGDIRVAHQGERDPAYSEAATSTYMQGEDIRIRVDLGLGKGKATVWTCDLTKEYVAINGDYRS